MTALTKFFGRLRLIGSGLVYAAKLLFSNSKDHKGKKVLLNVKSAASPKYFATLILFFLNEGYCVTISLNFKFLASLSIYKSLIESCGGISATFRSPGANIVVADHSVKVLPTNAKFLKISYNYFSKLNGLVLPYPMNAVHYAPAAIQNLHGLRVSKRRVGIYFSGNQDEKTYDNPIISEKFKKVSRIKMINYLKVHLSADVLTVSSTAQRSDCQRKLFIADWSWRPEKFENPSARTDDQQWLAQLARCNFFLALPGMVMPMCHNAIESMAVGTIPILEYPEEFYPALEHNINAIVYSGEADALEKIKYALSLPDEIISKMRLAVIEYYENHLSPSSFVARIENLPGGQHTLTMNVEQLSVYA